MAGWRPVTAVVPLRALRVAGLALLLGACATQSGMPGSSGNVSGAPSPSSVAAPVASPLLGTVWKVQYVGSEPVPRETGAEAASLRLDPAGARVEGFAGVNAFAGPAYVSGGSISFGRLVTTARAGTPSVSAFEYKYLSALWATSSWRISGWNLELLDRNGRPLATFQAQPGS
jgi:heat shock protein HslJ